MAQQPQNPKGPDADRGVWDEALDPEQVRSLNSALHKLADGGGAGKELQDTAKNLLSGRLQLRDALDDPSAVRALSSGPMASLRNQWESLSDEEQEQIRQGEAPASDGAPSDPNAPRRSGEDSPQPRKSQGRHSGGFSLY
ncbi:hypothetical protein AR457_01395 [Streptomyces agglomeratus]|uniref:Uncharacterized protein n=1 Tax=Streptomyces agglomeratus TaxID=285458 RepID=A0A1E5P1K7_9ACTN|nr:hypothetical protein [Streptomyces agglomeratus]OEJ23377.1 hypothetical protein AS594_01570 [Streptomyces agglomeratus]OEJ42958.1 hypothetical protein AR457_01395 [Streptomyces agglomeratus]OEJ55117.1 hypothetical protein BGK72_34330 [Streptomyces agglomeratus]OEJ62484.1 hypothetical protein BGM19_35285 [Streptomyces agglomeratus]